MRAATGKHSVPAYHMQPLPPPGAVPCLIRAVPDPAFCPGTDARDAMAKAVYGRLFGWMVYKINQLLEPAKDAVPAHQIGSWLSPAVTRALTAYTSPFPHPLSPLFSSPSSSICSRPQSTLSCYVRYSCFATTTK